MKKLILIFVVIGFISISYFALLHSVNNPFSSKNSQRTAVVTVVDSFFTELKNGDINTALKYVELDSSFNSLELALKDKTYEELLRSVLSKIQYKIGDITVSDSSATAMLDIETVDLFSFYNKYSKELNPFIKTYISGNEKQKVQAKDQIIIFLTNRVEGDIQKGDYEKFKGSLKINLVNKNGKWLIKADENLMYYLSGKLSSLIGK